jgi:hypothetical protein
MSFSSRFVEIPAMDVSDDLISADWGEEIPPRSNWDYYCVWMGLVVISILTAGVTYRNYKTSYWAIFTAMALLGEGIVFVLFALLKQESLIGGPLMAIGVFFILSSFFAMIVVLMRLCSLS